MTGRSKEGDTFGYVGSLIDEDWTPEEKPADHIQPPRHEGQPEFPPPGIYFGLSEEDYHAVPAASTSGLKHLSVSSMDFWANSWLNLDREEPEDKPHFNFGKAIHCFVLEGEGCYQDRYAVDLDPADFSEEKPLVSTDQIKAAIGAITEIVSVRPIGQAKQGLIDQLAALGEKHGVPVDLNGTVDVLKERIRGFEEDAPVRPISRIEEDDGDGNRAARAAIKPDWIAQLLALDPQAKIWDRMVADHRAHHEGKSMIGAHVDRRVRIAAKMILAHPEIGKAIEGGFPEVSVFWHCRKTGVPMKARFDMLKMRVIADLKSFSNKVGKPIRSAINTAIASYRYNIQHVVYVEAALAARELIRTAKGNEGSNSSYPVFVTGTKGEAISILDWCLKWAGQTEPPEFLFIFQQTGIAPVTRGRLMPRNSLYSVTRSRVDELKRQWAECAVTYGTDPWIDLEPITETEDEEIPEYATDIGRIEI